MFSVASKTQQLPCVYKYSVYICTESESEFESAGLGATQIQNAPLPTQLIEFAAFIKLRRAAREIHRPYRIPVNDRWGVTLFFAPAAIFLLLVMSQVLT